MARKLVELEFNLLDKLLCHSIGLSVDKETHCADVNYTIDKLIEAVSMLNNKKLVKEYITKLALVPLLKRGISIKHGEGERDVSYWAFIKIHTIIPFTMEYLLEYFPYIGYWGDLNNLYKIIYDTQSNPYKERLLKRIVELWVSNLKIEEQYLNNNMPSCFSLLCKWIPKQNGSLHKSTKVVNKIVKMYYPTLYKKNRFAALKTYRQLVSHINRQIKTTEIYMCNKEFYKINFKAVPVKCLRKNKNAWLDVNKTGTKRRNLLLLDRTVARNNYLDFMNTNKNIHLNIKPKDNSDRVLLLSDKLDDDYWSEYHILIDTVGEVNHLSKLIFENK